MGEAVFSRLLQVVEKSTSLMVSEMDAKRRDAIMEKYRIIVEIDNNRLVKYSDVIILAVKPKDLEGVLKQEVCCGVGPDKLIISIAAGVTTKFIESIVGRDVPVIRVMPNMPGTIGEGISSISAGTAANKEDMDIAREIFSMIGDVVEVEEKSVDAITAISGSGPAYFFYMMESLIDSAVKLRLDRKIAERLVIKTALGSAKLIESLKADPAELRHKVTSKGGTTEAALKVFNKNKFRSILRDATAAACRRSKEMSKG